MTTLLARPQRLSPLQDLAEVWDNQCAYCCRRFVGKRKGKARAVRASRDHVVPLAKGGAREPSNVVPACRACNHAKCDRELWRDFVPPLPHPKLLETHPAPLLLTMGTAAERAWVTTRIRIADGFGGKCDRVALDAYLETIVEDRAAGKDWVPPFDVEKRAAQRYFYIPGVGRQVVRW